MGKRFFDYDPLTGTTEHFESTEDGGFRIYTTAPTDPIVESNKAKKSMGRDYYAKDPDMWRVASIPNIILLKWAEELGVPPSKVFSEEFSEIIARRINCSDYRDFKTADVTI